ncbi:nitroreductase family protein [uncultured Bacteroides sp.]|uniref:nitroreductase family protein n=1 Tax=uncultured Bacteroides sp. TaxID=162156 RepID=UPI0026235F83|nr:nitroreductase family protein [uncultured Bacteroides sp.]
MITEEKSEICLFQKGHVSLLLVSNIHKMIHHKSEEKRTRYSNMDIGYVSQNIYLYCSANNLSTCACGLINFDRLNEILDSENTGKKAMLVHPVSIGKDYDNEPNK